MADPFTLSVSVLALAVSAATAWLTLFRRGTVQMTHPTVIYFGPDKARPLEHTAPPKVYLRALIFATSKRGRIVESMHVSLARAETTQNFNIWVHGAGGNLVRGSGLFVGETGVATDHHFLTPNEESKFKFLPGHYRLAIHARLLGDKKLLTLFSHQLEITSELAAQLDHPETGLYFDWGPDSARYLPHINVRSSLAPEQLLESLGLTRRSSGAPPAPDEFKG